MKIVTVIGARPQFVKAAVVSREISKYDNIKECIIHTGQHFDKNMSTVFFEEMQIPLPDYNLNINGLSHGAMTGQMLEGIESILFKEKPDWVLVYGDTNSTLAGALAARKNLYRQDFFKINVVNINDKVNSLTDKHGRIQRCYCAYNSADYRENEIERIRLCIFQQLCKNCKTAVVSFFTHRRLSPFQVLLH